MIPSTSSGWDLYGRTLMAMDVSICLLRMTVRQIYLYRNEGGGHFKEMAYDAGVAVGEDGSEQANMGVALGDPNHTGRFSILVSHFSEEYAALYRK